MLTGSSALSKERPRAQIFSVRPCAALCEALLRRVLALRAARRAKWLGLMLVSYLR